MISTVSFSGVFTIDEHIRVLGELNALNSYKCGKQYDCEVYKDQKNLIHMDLKQNNKDSEVTTHE